MFKPLTQHSIGDKVLEKCSDAEAPAKKRKLNTCKLKCSIISCDESFSKMRDAINHLNEGHHQNLEVQHLKFSTEAEFDEWIRNVERSELCNFLRRYVNKQSSAVHAYYYCSRSGRSRIITEPRKRHLKVQGYSKINRTCPAHIIKHVRHDGISVDYYATHLCYTGKYEQLGHVRLSVADRAWLAGKLELRIPLDAILRDVRNTFDGQLTRLHLVTKRDLVNIERAFHKPGSHHEDDASGVTASGYSSDYNDGAPVVDHKQQRARLFDTSSEGVDSTIAPPTKLAYDEQFDRLTTICKGKYRYTKKLSELRKRHAASITMQSISYEVVTGKEWLVHSDSEEPDYCTVRLANTECDCSIKCSECAACIHRYSCTCPDNQSFSNMCKHIHCIGMLNVHMNPGKTNATYADSDSAVERDVFQNGTTDELRLHQESEAAALVQQLACPIRKLEVRRKQLEAHLHEMSLIIKSLKTLEEMDVVDSTFSAIKPKLMAVSAQKAVTSLETIIDSCKEPMNKNVKNPQRFSTNL